MQTDSQFWADAVSEWSDPEPTAVTVVETNPLPPLNNSKEWKQLMKRKDDQMLNESQVIATENIEECGAIVYWSLTGHVNYARLSEAWADAGLPEDLFLNPVTENAALRRALNDVQDRRVLVRPLKKRGHFAIVEESASEEQVNHRQLALVFLESTEDSACKVLRVQTTLDAALEEEDGEAIVQFVERLREDIEARYVRELDSLTHSDIGSWLIRLAKQQDAISLRDRGGMYFVPRAGIDQWRRIVSVLRENTEHHVHEIPALRTDEAVDAILSSLEREAEAEAQEFERVMGLDHVGKRGLESQQRKCAELRAKMRRYEDLLGRSLDGIQGRLVDVEGQLAAAALACITAEE